MVGTNTALYDKPQLTVREWTGRNPVRIVVDRNGILPAPLPATNGEGANTNSLIITDWKQILLAPPSGAGGAVIIEGGAKLLQSFINENLFDEIRVFRSKMYLEKGIAAPVLPKNIRLTKKQNLMGDELSFYEIDANF